MSLDIKAFFHEKTATFSYILTDLTTKKAAILDPVLDYDLYSGRTRTIFADQLIAYSKKEQLSIEWILETHIHADHLTASHYLKEKLGGKTGIGSLIKKVLDLWVPIFNTYKDTPLDGSQFDFLFEDGDIFNIGHLDVKVLHTKGHTPACVSYLIDDCLFVGDTLFMPDIGTARTDFKGGSAAMMYDSIQKIFALPDDTKLFMCHDYPPKDRKICFMSTVKEQKEKNILVGHNISKEEYILLRNRKDQGKAVPQLMLSALQINLRAGSFGQAENNDIHYIKIPINTI